VTAAAAPVVELRGVSRHYGDVTALHRADLTVRRGELLAVVGPSGSGKSTLLNVIGTLQRPSCGTLLIDGHDVGTRTDRELSALRAGSVGFVFQQFHLAPGVPVIDNVADGLLYSGRSRGERLRLADRALRRVGLGHRLYHRPHQLSGGEKQRTAIARAVLGDPPLLLADEPTGALDSETGETVRALLRKRCDEGAAGVMVTHEPRYAAWADRVIFLKDGIVVDQSVSASAESLLTGEAAR
jgi:putative ABC transport system ATP-binding protein